jgi:hypothetical protein
MIMSAFPKARPVGFAGYILAGSVASVSVCGINMVL